MIPVSHFHWQIDPHRLSAHQHPFPLDIAEKWHCVRILVKIVSPCTFKALSLDSSPKTVI